MHHLADAWDALRGPLGCKSQSRGGNQRDDELEADRAERLGGQLPDELSELLTVQEAVQVDVKLLRVLIK